MGIKTRHLNLAGGKYLEDLRSKVNNIPTRGPLNNLLYAMGLDKTAIASEFGNSAKVIVPRSWLGKKVIVFLHSEYISKHPFDDDGRLVDERYNKIVVRFLQN